MAQKHSTGLRQHILSYRFTVYVNMFCLHVFVCILCVPSVCGQALAFWMGTTWVLGTEAQVSVRQQEL